jgi:hypothetical protein
MSRTLFRSFAVLAAVASLASVAGTSAASAAAPAKGKPTATHSVHHGTSTATRRAPGSGSVTLPNPVTSGGKAVAMVQGGATGDGPWNESQCEAIGNQVNEELDQSDADYDEGDTHGAQSHWYNAKNMQDYGEDNGCFFVDPIE